MRKMIIYSSKIYRQLFFLTALFLCCTEPDNAKVTSSVISLNPKSTTDIGLKGLIKDWHFLELKIKNNFIGTADKVIIGKDNIYILDIYRSMSLFIFDKKGNHLNTINRPGRGPGEFLSPVDFEITDETQEIIIYDQAGLKLIFYDQDGNFKLEKTLNLNPDRFGHIKDKYIFLLGNFDENNGNKKLVVTDSTFKVLESFVEMRSELIGLHFDIPTNITKNKSTFLVTIPFDNTLYRLNSELELEKISIDFADFNISEAFYNKFPNKRDRYRLLDGKAYNVSTYFENEKIRFFTYNFNRKYNFYYKSLISGEEKHDSYSNIFQGIGPITGMPLTLEQENLVWFQHNDQLQRYFKQKEESLSESEFKEFKDRNIKLTTLFEALKDTDNPYLIFCSIE